MPQTSHFCPWNHPQTGSKTRRSCISAWTPGFPGHLTGLVVNTYEVRGVTPNFAIFNRFNPCLTHSTHCRLIRWTTLRCRRVGRGGLVGGWSAGWGVNTQCSSPHPAVVWDYSICIFVYNPSSVQCISVSDLPGRPLVLESRCLGQGQPPPASRPNIWPQELFRHGSTK